MAGHEISLKDRLRGAVWGEFVGDAAALGTHWIYDLDELKEAYPDVRGFETPAPDHYHHGKAPGDQTHYGDAALLLLESIADCEGFELSDFARRFERLFGSSQYRGYVDHATKGTLENLRVNPEDLQNGADDDQPATVTRLAPLVARYHGAPDLLEQVTTLTRFCQRNALAVSYARACAELLEALCHGLEPEAALKAVNVERATRDVESVRALEDLPVVEAVQRFGQSCPLEKSFPSAVHAFLREGNDFRAAILETLCAGGDSAARASMVGMWCGALNGLEGVPAEWRNRLSARDRIEKALEAILER